MNTKTRILIGILFIIILTLLAIVIAGAREKVTATIQNGDSPIAGIVNPETPPTGNTSGGGMDAQPIACTMDARMCPDGSYVGRSGPNCEFVCPGTPVVDPIAPPKDPYNRYVASGCKVVEGCNGPITCVDEDVEIGGSTCEYLPEYACYKASTNRCEKQASTNTCGWTPTPTLNACIDTARNSS